MPISLGLWLRYFINFKPRYDCLSMLSHAASVVWHNCATVWHMPSCWCDTRRLWYDTTVLLCDITVLGVTRELRSLSLVDVCMEWFLFSEFSGNLWHIYIYDISLWSILYYFTYFVIQDFYIFVVYDDILSAIRSMQPSRCLGCHYLKCWSLMLPNKFLWCFIYKQHSQWHLTVIFLFRAPLRNYPLHCILREVECIIWSVHCTGDPYCTLYIDLWLNIHVYCILASDLLELLNLAILHHSGWLRW